jgi:hypothetical protein
MSWKAGERESLIYLTLNGPSDQKTIADTYHLTAPTINLAKDSLVERGYIALKGREIRGRGAPRKIYGLTPAGLIAAVHEGDLWDSVQWLMKLWGDVAPIFIRRYGTLWEAGFGGDAKNYCEVALSENKITIETLGKEEELAKGSLPRNLVEAERDPEGHGQPDPWMDLLSVIDRGFYAEMHRLHEGADLYHYLKTVNDDKELFEGWLRWFEWEKNCFKELKEHRRILLNDQPHSDSSTDPKA